jgi:hypothetical protein
MGGWIILLRRKLARFSTRPKTMKMPLCLLFSIMSNSQKLRNCCGDVLGASRGAKKKSY